MGQKNVKSRVVSPDALKPCPESPNCVSSQHEHHRVDAIKFTLPADVVWAQLMTILQQTKRIKIIMQSETYVHAVARSWLFRFVDDIEFLLLPEESLIHVRSASRVGYSDFGVNRRRVERLREALID
ncbi:MAG: DUF1499 domain-containing protein [Gammaproteobacteria bacterium]